MTDNTPKRPNFGPFPPNFAPYWAHLAPYWAGLVDTGSRPWMLSKDMVLNVLYGVYLVTQVISLDNTVQYS